MEQAEQLLREWCERHSGWTYSTRQIGPLFADDNLRGVSWKLECLATALQLRCNVAWTMDELANAYEDPRGCKNHKAVMELIEAAEQYIRDNTNEGGGCTPTRR